MDPNAKLADIRSLLAYEESNPLTRDQFEELSDRIRALDEWLSKGGFLPDAWDSKNWTPYPSNTLS